MRVSYLVVVAGLFLSAGSASAQKSKKEAPKKVSPRESCTEIGGRVECYERRVGPDSMRTRIFSRLADMDSARMRRAALGMQLSATGSLRDTIGVFVSHVTPKGPAENAGIVEGDRIVSINGVDLRISAADVDDSYTSGLPSHRLTREVAKLTPGSRVNLRVYSGGRVRDVQVTAGRASDVFKGERGFGYDFGRPGAFFPGMPGDMRIFRGVPPADLRIFRDGPGSTRIYRDAFPRKLEELKALEKLDELPEKMQKLEKLPDKVMMLDRLPDKVMMLEALPDKVRMIQPLKIDELNAKLRSIEPALIRSLEMVPRLQPLMIDRWTVRI